MSLPRALNCPNTRQSWLVSPTTQTKTETQDKAPVLKQQIEATRETPKTPEVKIQTEPLKVDKIALPEVEKSASEPLKNEIPPVVDEEPPRKVWEEKHVPSSPLSRILGFGGLAARLAVGTATEIVRSGGRNGTYNALVSDANAEKLAETLCTMRGAALKLGQMLSIQDEAMIPSKLAVALDRVRENAHVMPKDQLHQQLKTELGDDWRDNFQEFDDVPIAAASIGQVHRATLLNGDRVAIKIQYPGVAESIGSDLLNLKRLVTYTNILPRGLYIDEIIRVGKEELTAECDYIAEADNQERFKQLIEQNGMGEKYVVPRVYRELSTARILTTQLISGVAVDKAVHLSQDVRDSIARRILELTIHELFNWRFMQTDPNWSNFMYNASTDTIGLVDFGAAREYPKSFVDDYFNIVWAAANEDEKTMVDYSIKMHFLTGDESPAMMRAHVAAGMVVGEKGDQFTGYERLQAQDVPGANPLESRRETGTSGGYPPPHRFVLQPQPEDENSVSDEPDPVAEDPLARYRTMLKVGVPLPAVERQMRKNGINPAALNGSVLEESPEVEATATMATTERRKWHWNEVAAADRAPPPPNGSVWTRDDEEDAHQRVTALSQARIQELFVREIGRSVEGDERDSLVSMTSETEVALIAQRPSWSVKTEKIQVMKGTKGTNLEFVVSRLKFPFAKVAQDVNILTAMYLQDTDIKTILAMWPSVAEQVLLDEYAGDFNELGRCEQFLVKIRSIPMAKEKLQCLLLKLELQSRAEDLKQLMELVTRALNQICSSSKFGEVIRLLRDFGNLANEEFVANYRARFSLESLLNLSHTKAFDKKTTIFDAFLYLLRTEKDGNLANFYDEIHLVMQCKGVSVGGLTVELGQLREGHQLVKSVAIASSKSSDKDAKLAHDAFNQFADEIDDKLRGVHESFDKMEESHRKFVSWFEENPNVQLDQHLKAIAQFASDVKDRFAVLNFCL
ncbi:uncharacterized protein PITG_01317 [Phytophthora infestans T30-4]|uniref:FH2 domain-containing protein n=1 Tax=Phytophthora infestans (strain T30-4) TaxID=403677 RepID=D0MV78_PHYIT|nr:uncharacterized protein PITG_01317 [Phytophthora infestans T30-4]EEY61074.1 conserved hypothetical protein [Phytophthora infestans T30-4]|eukprot:XP_002907991.1 conserved hypothetical protein [Phytophthora infestans T30-4]